MLLKFIKSLLFISLMLILIPFSIRSNENLESIGLVRNYDTRGEKIFRSFGINNVHFLKYGGIFRKLIFFFRSIKYGNFNFS